MRNKWTESFLLEAEELLAEIEECALAINHSEEVDEIVGRLFRAFHTIKGTGAMCGLEDVASFTHHVETLLDDLREGRVERGEEFSELILASVDQIKALLAAECEGETANATADARLIARIYAASASGAQVAAQSKAMGASLEAEEGAADRCWKIYFKPAAELYACGGNPALVLRELEELGSIEVAVHTDELPAMNALQPALSYLSWSITLRTSAEENAIRDVFLFVEDGAELRIEAEERADDAEKTKPADVVNSGNAVSENILQNAKLQKNEGAAARGAVRESVVRVPAARLDRLVNLVGELVMNQSRVLQIAQGLGHADLMTPVQEMDRLVAELRDDVLGIRMLPIGSIFGHFQRLVHDLARELDKDVVLETSGAETELDKSILDQLSEPLVHMIRNSIDHGIESRDVRESAGKPVQGTIRLSAEHRGSDVVVSIEDDGKGISREAVREKAISRGLIAPDAVLSEKEIFALILQPGFSTAQQITSVSGRGVGMDVVKKQIESLRGSLSIMSEAGKGTCISLSLPLTLAIIEGLIVQVGADQFVVPMAAVTENVEIEGRQRLSNNGRNVIAVRGELISYIDLRSAFAVEGASPEIEKIVIVRHEESRVGLLVDRVLGTHQTVLQSLGRFFRNIEVVSGATILGDGRVALILDVGAIVRHVERCEVPDGCRAVNKSRMA